MSNTATPAEYSILHASPSCVVVVVPSRSSDDAHLTTVAGDRASCTCRGARTHGNCYHIGAVRMLRDALARRAA